MKQKKIDAEDIKKKIFKLFKIEIAPYTEADDPGMLELWKKSYPDAEEWGQDFFDWQYKNNPEGRALIWLAKVGPKIVAKFVHIPMRVKLGEKECVALESINTVIDKNYRGTGVFFPLIDISFSDAGEKGYAFSYGLPNKISMYNSLNAGFESVGRLYPMIKMTGFSAVVKERLKIKAGARFGRMVDLLTPAADILIKMIFMGDLFRKRGGSVIIKKADKADERFDRLWRKVKDSFTNIIVRDSRFIRWRFFEKPGYDYEVFTAEENGDISGYCVLLERQRKEGRMGVIVDILADSDRSYRVLIDAAALHFKKKGIDLVIALCNEKGLLRRALNKCGFLKCPEIFISDPVALVMKPLSGKLDRAEIMGFDRWRLTFGDFDLY